MSRLSLPARSLISLLAFSTFAVSSQALAAEAEQVETLRSRNEELETQNAMMVEELKQLRSMLQRIQIAMSQGVEL